MNAIVLAGGPPDAVAALEPGVPNKAFVRIAGRTLVARTIAALRACPDVERIVVVAPAGAPADALDGADERRPDGARVLDSLAAGVAGFAPDEPLLVTASDLPVLSGIAVGAFCAGATERELDLAYAIVERRVHAALYPQIPHTWARLRDGTFCGGGVVALRPRVVARLGPLLDAFGAARKSPLRLAALLGWDVLAAYAAGYLTVAAAERRASALLGAPAGAVRCPHPEIAVNVDRPSDVALANELAAAAAKAAG